ncbi:MAG: hypothetical protein AMXMBFR33_07560 [Candidatus Xenobia bacterium]
MSRPDFEAQSLVEWEIGLHVLNVAGDIAKGDGRHAGGFLAEVVAPAGRREAPLFGRNLGLAWLKPCCYDIPGWCRRQKFTVLTIV